MIPDQALNESAVAAALPERSCGQSDAFEKAIEKLKDSAISARKDLKVSRHLFRDEPSYIVHDPVSFQSHRFSQQDYLILSSLKRSQTLDETFTSLRESTVYKGDRESFYRFILDVQMRGLLDLPLTDGTRLFDRYRKRTAAQKKFSIMKMLFIKIPLLNPDRLLDRTVHLARPLFTKWFFAIWVVMMVVAMGLLATRLEDFYSPLANVLATRNLVILFLVMTGLKFWHELGHAYACKVNGGAVPDMGAFCMAGMPMAYVDVSSSWSFPTRNRRILVGLGGMYFESIAACIAMYVWALTGPGIVNSTAHFVVLMAGFMTIAFNANPLMRYDGYYVLSDMTGVPNLRQRAMEFSGGFIKRVALGLPMRTSVKSATEAGFLLSYGVAAFVYQLWIMLVIAFVIAQQFFIVGLVMAGGVVVNSLVKPVTAMFKYLWFSPELDERRPRAIVASAAILGLVIGAFTFIPVPGGVVATGQLTHEKIQSVRVPFDGHLTLINVAAGEKISAGTPILSLGNSDVADQFRLAAAQNQIAEKQSFATLSASPAVQRQSQLEREIAEKRYLLAKAQAIRQSVKAEFGGIVLKSPQSHELGGFREAGTELARIGNGVPVVQAIVNSEQLASIRPNVGDSVTVRLKSDSTRSLTGTIDRIDPQGSKLLQMDGLSTSAGGDILANDEGFMSESTFVIEVRLEELYDPDTPEKSTAYIRFGRKFETLGNVGIRSLFNFFNQLFSK